MTDLTTYQQYVGDVKLWANQIRQILLEQRSLDPNLEKVEIRIQNLINYLNGIQGEITDEMITAIKNEADLLYTHGSSILAEALERQERFNANTSVPIGGHSLPPLPYSYDALEPYISEEIMRLHHTKHHQSYVDGLNKAERMMANARNTGDFELIKHWEREAAFHGSGHYLHTIFWNVMSPRPKSMPTGKLLARINQDFSSFEAFKKHFTEAANKVEGVGWAILVWSPRSHRLEILQSERHQLMTQWDTIPLLVLDVWEHAYYLQYKNVKEDYVKNWWNVVNWAEVENRFNEASKLKWKPF